MPREQKKRGRRAEAKSQSGLGSLDEEPQAKRLRADTATRQPDFEDNHDYVKFESDSLYHQNEEFFGSLGDKEQEYFRAVISELDAARISDHASLQLLLDNVHQESQGLETKLACSQSCSRLSEMLVAFSNPNRLQGYFNAFSGHWAALLQHRFASHVCEILFLKSAILIALSMDHRSGGDAGDEEIGEDSLQTSFVNAVREVGANIFPLLTDPFASHPARVLVDCLSANFTLRASGLSSMVGKKSVEVLRSSEEVRRVLDGEHDVTVPVYFSHILSNLLSSISQQMDPATVRSLAKHPVGNPSIQTIIENEIRNGGKAIALRSDSVIFKLVTADVSTDDDETTAFLIDLCYDVVGSRLVEFVVQKLPGKQFRNLYHATFRPRMRQLARNDIAAFVVLKIIERLSPEDLHEAAVATIPEIPGLAAKGRTAITRCLVDRFRARSLDVAPLLKAIVDAYPCKSDLHSPATINLVTLLGLRQSDKETEGASGSLSHDLLTVAKSRLAQNNMAEIHAASLLQSMLAVRDSMAAVVYSSLAELDTADIMTLACRPHPSRVLQVALTSPQTDFTFRRKMLSRFDGYLPALAVDPVASHLVDSLWSATLGMPFYRERMARELASAEMALRDSKPGRAVWRNWNMDLHKSRPGAWMRLAKGVASNRKRDSTNVETDSGPRGRPDKPPAKSRLQLAREKYANSVAKA